jgi:Na+/H+ antiporter NhaD/arsenite permease-like protein
VDIIQTENRGWAQLWKQQYKKNKMKHSRVFWLVSVGTLLFAIGLFVPVRYYLAHSGLLLAGAALVLLFYMSTLVEVIRSKGLSPGRRVFWLVVIICAPVVGNLLYILTQDLTSQKQTPRLQNF